MIPKIIHKNKLEDLYIDSLSITLIIYLTIPGLDTQTHTYTESLDRSCVLIGPQVDWLEVISYLVFCKPNQVSEISIQHTHMHLIICDIAVFTDT